MSITTSYLIVHWPFFCVFKVRYMVNAWKGTQSDQEVLCESLIQCLHETPNEQGQGVPKPEFNELIACLEKFCTNQGDCAHFTFLFLLQLLV